MDQRVFDEAVDETMELLDMSYSEALKDTISQFQQMVRSKRNILVQKIKQSFYTTIFFREWICLA